MAAQAKCRKDTSGSTFLDARKFETEKGSGYACSRTSDQKRTRSHSPAAFATAERRHEPQTAHRRALELDAVVHAADQVHGNHDVEEDADHLEDGGPEKIDERLLHPPGQHRVPQAPFVSASCLFLQGRVGRMASALRLSSQTSVACLSG